MITRIEAHNYRCFPKLAIDLDRYHVLAGANGAGKTTLLDIPVFIGDMVRARRVVSAVLARGEARRAARASALTDLLHNGHGASNAEFGKLAATMSVKYCQDQAFIQLRDKLRAWFPEQL